LKNLRLFKKVFHQQVWFKNDAGIHDYYLFEEYQSVISSRQQLDSQLTENSGVKEELNLLESDANVFKLIGPVLVKQDLEEARQNVNKRIDYITGET
jgi:chaperonin cofactor prefoldin